MPSEFRPGQAATHSARALAAALPAMTEEMHRVNRLIEAGRRPEAIEQFYALVSAAVRTQRQDLTGRGHVIPCRTTEISVYRMPAEPRPDKPIALFLPGLLAALPLAAVRALAFIDLFDIVLCELPGHGASGEVPDVSLATFAAEYAALIDIVLRRATGLFVIGESLGGLIALMLARLRPGPIRNVILIDTPFHLTRPELATCISGLWQNMGRRTYVARICQEIMGINPADARMGAATQHYDMVRDAPFGCVHIVGGNQPCSNVASAVSDADIAALQAANPAMLFTPRVGGTGHAVLVDNPDGARAALEALIASRPRI